jgi:DNA-binding CsgD family transcriptional regulator
MDKLEKSIKEHRTLRFNNLLIEEDINYEKAAKYRGLLDVLDSLKTSTILVLDYFKNEFYYMSDKVANLGFGPDMLVSEFLDWYRGRFHPDDHIVNTGGAMGRQYFYDNPKEKPSEYVLTCEFRILNDSDKWIRLISQNTILETDSRGTPWLVLNLLDFSPETDLDAPGRVTLRHSKTKKVVFSLEGKSTPEQNISKREKEVLNLISTGKRSKEIADELQISVNTVNNHRKNIMEKLGVQNSFEAVKKALDLGIM